MAEGIFKKLIGRSIFVQSVGIYDSLEIDGFTVRVCDEIDVKLNQHRVRSLKEVEKKSNNQNKTNKSTSGFFQKINPFK